MNALLLGGAGFIGAHLASRLHKQGWTVCIADLACALDEIAIGARTCQAYRRELLTDVARRDVDIRDRLSVDALFRSFQPEVVYCLAGTSLVKDAQSDILAASQSMVKGVINVLEAVCAYELAKRFVFVSSSMVYGNFTLDPVPEASPTLPCSAYGQFKLAAECLVQSYLSSTTTQSVIVRPSAVYGVGDSHSRIVPNICNAAAQGERIVIRNPEKTRADFTAVDDVAQGLDLAGSMPLATGQTFNISRGHGRTLMELMAMAQAMVPTIDVTIETVDDATIPLRGALDISKAQKLLGFAPRIDLEAGLAQCLDYMMAPARNAAAAR